MVSHPNLPLFAASNKGFIELFPFNSVYSRIAEYQTNNKEVINVMKFNNYGDKIGAVDNGGSLFLWKLNK